MGFRFRRTVKIMPGVRLNVGKKGVSVSAGRRGANVTIGKTGVRTTVGLPGTGLSHTTLHRSNAQGRRARPLAPQRERKRPIILFSIALLLVIIFAVLTT